MKLVLAKNLEMRKVVGVSEMVAAEKMAEIVKLLEDLAGDRRVPRNVRATVLDAVRILREEKESDIVKLNTVIGMMDEISNDPNIQPYTRTQIWNIVSVLEAVQAEEAK